MATNLGLATPLTAIRDVPGVLGGMACDARGRVLDAWLPPQLGRAQLEEAALLLADATGALEVATGTVAMLDFGSEDARVVVKPLGGGFLLRLCSGSAALEPIAGALAARWGELERLARGLS